MLCEYVNEYNLWLDRKKLKTRLLKSVLLKKHDNVVRDVNKIKLPIINSMW